MKRWLARALSLFALSLYLTAANTQTRPNKNRVLPYDDADGYRVLSSIINETTNKSRGEPVAIFHQTISEEAVGDIRFQCAGSIPVEFQSAAEDFDKKAKTNFLLQQEFSIRRKYKLVVHSQSASISAAFSVSAVGFDESKAHAIALVRYIVHNGGTIGGDSTFHFLRKADHGWLEAMEIQKCGRIY